MPSDRTGARATLEKAIFLKPTSGMALVPVECVTALLAALDAAEAERDRLRQWAPNVRFIAQEKYPRLHELADLLAATPTETPDAG